MQRSMQAAVPDDPACPQLDGLDRAGTQWATSVDPQSFENFLSLTLWTIATATATVFKIVTEGSKKTLRPL